MIAGRFSSSALDFDEVRSGAATKGAACLTLLTDLQFPQCRRRKEVEAPVGILFFSFSKCFDILFTASSSRCGSGGSGNYTKSLMK